METQPYNYELLGLIIHGVMGFFHRLEHKHIERIPTYLHSLGCHVQKDHERSASSGGLPNARYKFVEYPNFTI